MNFTVLSSTIHAITIWIRGMITTGIAITTIAITITLGICLIPLKSLYIHSCIFDHIHNQMLDRIHNYMLHYNPLLSLHMEQISICHYHIPSYPLFLHHPLKCIYPIFHPSTAIFSQSIYHLIFCIYHHNLHSHS